MDIRQTFASTQELSEILLTILDEGSVAALLVDDQGLTRVSGKIASIINDRSNTPVSVSLDSGIAYRLSDIIAVNGIFRSDYSEC